VWGNEAVPDDERAPRLISPASTVVPVAPALEESVKSLFLQQAQKRGKQLRFTSALKWKSQHRKKEQ
jgi:hypothetical protein